MISFDFDYYKPDTVEEAVKSYKDLEAQGKSVLYYAGGSEIISQARVNQLRFDAVIDIKGIPECNQLELQNDKLVIGAAVSLTKISDSGYFPLLSSICRRSADHTARNRITLGGNICSRMPYKETVLPLLLSDSEVVIAGENGLKVLPLGQVFQKEMRLSKGEFLVRVVIERSYTALPFVCIKKTKDGGQDYPLVTVASIKKDKCIRTAFSGICSYPFRQPAIEDDLNSESYSLEEKLNRMLSHFPDPILTDMLGSSEYREYITRNTVREVCEKLGGIK